MVWVFKGCNTLKGVFFRLMYFFAQYINKMHKSATQPQLNPYSTAKSIKTKIPPYQRDFLLFQNLQRFIYYTDTFQYLLFRYQQWWCKTDLITMCGFSKQAIFF